MRKGPPGSLVVECLARDAVEGLAVQEPGDGLLLPGSRTSVDNHRPSMELVVGNADRLAKTIGFIAWSATNFSAVDSAEASHITVDSLEDVDLTAARPAGTVAEGIAQHPKGRPDALLTSRVAHSDAGLDTEDLVVVRMPGLLGLETSRGPFSLGVLPGDELECVTARELDVLVGGAVHLELVVGVDVEGRVPVVVLGSTALAASELFLPDDLKIWAVGHAGGRGQRGEADDDGEEVSHGVSREWNLWLKLRDELRMETSKTRSSSWKWTRCFLV